jgi:hypothetical protein
MPSLKASKTSGKQTVSHRGEGRSIHAGIISHLFAMQIFASSWFQAAHKLLFIGIEHGDRDSAIPEHKKAQNEVTFA